MGEKYIIQMIWGEDGTWADEQIIYDLGQARQELEQLRTEYPDETYRLVMEV